MCSSNFRESESKIITADELLPIWVYLIVKTPLGNWNAQLQYLRTFRFSADEQNDNENSFYIVTLEASLAHLKTGKVVGLAEGERDVGISCEVGDAWLLNRNNEEPSDPRLAEMFSAIKLGMCSIKYVQFIKILSMQVKFVCYLPHEIVILII